MMPIQIKNFARKVGPEWILRISLSVMYFYSGFDLFFHPRSWYWAVRPLPQFIQNFINTFGIDIFLKTQGVIELCFALILLLWSLPRILSKTVALLTAIEMAAILFLVGVDGITFRDIGILGAAFALYLILIRRGAY